MRPARGEDARALALLAALDGARSLDGETLIAVVDGELWAAIQLADGRTVADPFRPTRSVRELLALRRDNLLRARIRPPSPWRAPRRDPAGGPL